jgi:acetylornithine deacetylase/succinyl-diaminopimelate desuccinylase-like protein
MEVDLRSESADELAKEVTTFTHLMHEAVNEENQARSTDQGKIDIDIKLIGDRPPGTTAQDSTLSQTAAAMIHEFGMQPMFLPGSTDSNVPMSLRIPAITLESGGSGGRSHALDEWIDVDVTSSLRGIYIVLGTLLAVAGAP